MAMLVYWRVLFDAHSHTIVFYWGCASAVLPFKQVRFTVFFFFIFLVSKLEKIVFHQYFSFFCIFIFFYKTVYFCNTWDSRRSFFQSEALIGSRWQIWSLKLGFSKSWTPWMNLYDLERSRLKTETKKRMIGWVELYRSSFPKNHPIDLPVILIQQFLYMPCGFLSKILWYCWWLKSCTSWGKGSLCHYFQDSIHPRWEIFSPDLTISP